MAASTFIRPAISLTLVSLTVLGATNVYSDNSKLTASVEAQACGKVGCAVRLIREERSAFSQKFEFQTSMKPITTESFVCERAAILLGDYTCVPE